MAAFPQELVDMVIDLLRNDPKALAALALTARSWSPRSRKYLHKTLKLRHEDCIIYPASEVTRAYALLELPALMEFAEELVLDEWCWNYPGRESSDSEDRKWDEDLDDVDSNFAEILAPITKKCTNVRQLTIDHISWGVLPGSVHNRTWFCNAFPHIKSLTIKAGVFTSPEEFLTLLNTLPPLSRLEISDIRVYTSPVIPTYGSPLTFETKRNLSLLQELVVQDGLGTKTQPLRTIVNAFAEQGCSLKTLDISSRIWGLDDEKPVLVPWVTQLLGTASGSLTTLRLRFLPYSVMSSNNTKVIFQLGRCTMLNTIEFSFDVDSLSLRYNVSSWQIISQLLNHGFPSSLKHMKIVCIPDWINMGLFRFSELERLLTASNFSLESLTFEDALAPGDEHKILEGGRVRRGSWEGRPEPRIFSVRELRDTVMSKMPGLAASGVLRVTSQMRDVYCA